MSRVLDDLDIENNKFRFLELVSSIKRPGFDEGKLLNHLSNSDFFYAPASTKFHGSFRGGLVNHCLSVYDIMVNLNEVMGLNIDPESIKIVGLFHDISKMNYYETYYKNEKIYSENGSKSDDGGRYDWKQIKGYRIIDDKQRFLYYNHEGTSEFILRQYFPLTVEESIAILHHHGQMGADCAKDNISEIYNRVPLAVLLHTADLLSAYIIESDEVA